MHEHLCLAVCKNKQLRSAHKATYAICTAQLWEWDVSKQLLKRSFLYLLLLCFQSSPIKRPDTYFNGFMFILLQEKPLLSNKVPLLKF